MRRSLNVPPRFNPTAPQVASLQSKSPAPSPIREETRYVERMKRVITSSVASLICVAAFAGCSAAGETGSDVMLSECIDRVASWAGLSNGEVTGDDRNAENPSGSAWDFAGEYEGGAWACGGPAGQAEPSSVMVYPEDGVAQDIVSGGPPARSSGPVSVLAGMVEASQPPSPECLSGMSALADVSFSASEATQNAAVEASADACGTAAEYVLAMRAYPMAWGFTDASAVDGETALNALQAACSLSASSPVCTDASANGLF